MDAQYTLPDTYDYVDATVLKSAIYETASGIFDHTSPEANPLSSVAMHPAEKYVESSGMYDSIRKYTERGIKDRYGLSLIEYLELPREFQNMLTLRGLEMIDEAKKAKEKAKQEAEAENARKTKSIQIQ